MPKINRQANVGPIHVPGQQEAGTGVVSTQRLRGSRGLNSNAIFISGCNRTKFTHCFHHQVPLFGVVGLEHIVKPVLTHPDVDHATVDTLSQNQWYVCNNQWLPGGFRDCYWLGCRI